MKQDIKWDTQEAKPLDYAADDADVLINWVADQFWAESQRIQREFCGLFTTRDDKKIVTTVHKSSYHNVPRKYELDDWKSGAMNAHPPRKDWAGPGLVAYWHTHIRWVLKKGDPYLDTKKFDNKWRATYAWLGNDVDIIDELAKNYPNIVGYIVTDTQIGKYQPSNRRQPTRWNPRTKPAAQ
jgi:hypothetical protein